MCNKIQNLKIVFLDFSFFLIYQEYRENLEFTKSSQPQRLYSLLIP